MRVTPLAIREPQSVGARLTEGALEIDLTEVEWISPLGVVAVLATCLRADRTLGPTVNLQRTWSRRRSTVMAGS